VHESCTNDKNEVEDDENEKLVEVEEEVDQQQREDNRPSSPRDPEGELDGESEEFYQISTEIIVLISGKKPSPHSSYLSHKSVADGSLSVP
jgi:hypothetical protein